MVLEEGSVWYYMRLDLFCFLVQSENDKSLHCIICIAGLQRLLSFPANSELVYNAVIISFLPSIFTYKYILVQQNRH